MKKRRIYSAPEVCEYNAMPVSMLCTSGIDAGGENDYVGEGDALSNESRNDWNNIWGSM